MSTLTVTDDGFEIVTDSGDLSSLRWLEMKEIFAFKLDLGCYDTIRLGFRIDDSGNHYEIDEDWHGYKELLAEIERRYNMDDGWWSKVAFPAFATNRTTLWSESTI